MINELCPIDDILRQKIPCFKAKCRLENRGVRGEKLDEEKCPWYINSENHYYCFWIYIDDKNNHKERQLTEVANLLNTSINNVKLIEVGALHKIEKHLNHLKTYNKNI